MAILSNVFNIFDVTPSTTYPKQPKLDGQFVHPEDRWIVDRFYIRKHTPLCIAGGACLAWYQNRPVDSDIDLYFTNHAHYEIFKEKVLERTSSDVDVVCRTVTTSDNAITYRVTNTKTGKEWTVQLIKKSYYSNVQSVIDDFDITVCKIAFDFDKVFTSSTFAIDERNKELRFDNVSPQSHKRLVKYMSYGYQPTPETFELVCNSKNVDWTLTGADHYA